MMVEMTSRSNRVFDSVATDENDENHIVQNKLVDAEGRSTTKWVMAITAVTFFMMLAFMFTTRFSAKAGDGGVRTSRRWVPTLLTDIDVYPGYKGPLIPRGRVTVRFEDDETEMLIRYELEGLERNCKNCGIHIHEGENCMEAKDHYFNHSVYNKDEDPWKKSAFYSTNDDGMASSALIMATGGIGSRATDGHALVIHSQDGTRIGCGALKRTFNINLMEAQMDTYPGYVGKNIAPKGDVMVLVFEDDVIRIRGTIDGLEPNCVQCGLHIHAGLTCGDDSAGVGDNKNETSSLSKTDVGDHWYNKVIIEDDDPWKAQRAAYNSDSKGHAEFAFYVYNAYDYENNVDHALVLHGQDGTRIGCCILKPKEVS